MTAAPLDAFLFMLAATVISAAAHRYLYLRVLVWVFADKRWAAALSVVLGVLLPLGMLGLLLMNVVPRAVLRPIMWSAFTWVGVLHFTLIAGLVPVRGAWPLWIGAALGLACIANAKRPPLVVAREVSLAGWPLPGYRIAHLSDIHAGATTTAAFIADIVTRTNALAPDLVVITGDLVDGSPADLLPDLAPLAALRARDGVWFVLGNHEYLSRAERWIPAIESLGIQVLRDRWVALGPFDLVGLDDLSASPDVDRAFAGRDPTRVAIALAHQPLTAAAIVDRGVLLQLSGHTHGGQIAPYGWLESGCLVGLCREGRLTVHVTAGAGYWGPPMRFLSRGEIALLTIQSTVR